MIETLCFITFEALRKLNKTKTIEVLVPGIKKRAHGTNPQHHQPQVGPNKLEFKDLNQVTYIYLHCVSLIDNK